MKVKNCGKKLVHIGKMKLMPGGEVTVADKVCDTPAIKILAKRGLLALTSETDTTETAAGDTAETEAQAETEIQAETAVKKTAARKTAKASKTAE